MDQLRFATIALAIVATSISPPARAEVAVAPGGLAEALAGARPGDRLRLLAGIHRGRFVVNVPIQIEGAPGAILDGGGEGTPLSLAADGIVVSHLEIRGSGADLSHDDAVVRLVRAHDITVRGCRVEARAFGIYLEGGGRHVITGNEVRGDASLPVVRRGNGIHLWNSEANEIRDNGLSDVRDGVYLSFAHRNRIEGNHGNGLRYGIHYMYSEHNVLLGNRFRGCTGGIALMYSKQNRISGNQTTGNRDFGILCQQLEDSVLVGNRTSGNGRGLFLENSGRNRFLKNRVEENGVGVFLTAGSEANVFSRNRFAGNLVQVFEDRADGQVWSESGSGNYWGDYAGFDWNGDGIGELPYRIRTARSALLARWPAARWFLGSPVFALLAWWDRLIVDPAPGALDPAPLVGWSDQVS